jgi:hypothetical protein
MTRLWPAGEAVDTWGDADCPRGFVWRGASHQIVQICNRWRVQTRWWEPGQAVCREYWKVATDSGYLCQLYRDLGSGQWFFARLYD